MNSGEFCFSSYTSVEENKKANISWYCFFKAGGSKEGDEEEEEEEKEDEVNVDNGLLDEVLETGNNSNGGNRKQGAAGNKNNGNNGNGAKQR